MRETPESLILFMSYLFLGSILPLFLETFLDVRDLRGDLVQETSRAIIMWRHSINVIGGLWASPWCQTGQVSRFCYAY